MHSSFVIRHWSFRRVLAAASLLLLSFVFAAEATAQTPTVTLNFEAKRIISKHESSRDAFRLTRSGSTASSLVVYYTMLGSAVAGADYEALPGVVEFAPGVATVRIAVRPIAGGPDHDLKNIRLQLTANPSYNISNNNQDVFLTSHVVEFFSIPMRDGFHLVAETVRFANADLGQGGVRYPVTVYSSMYDQDFHRDRNINGVINDGQIYVGVHIRDSRTSDPQNQFNYQLGTYASDYQATEDAYDIVEWIARQPWCNGAVGFKGASGNGVGGSAAIWSNHPNLKAVSISHSSSNFHDYWLYYNGVKRDTYSLVNNRGGSSTARNSIRPDTVRTDKAEWMAWTRKKARESTPSYFESIGLYDIFMQAGLDNFSVLAPYGKAYVIMEPRWHGPAVPKYDGSGTNYNIFTNRPATPPSGSGYGNAMAGTNVTGNSVLNYATLDSTTNFYRSTSRFPLATTPVPFYLRGNGGLELTPPTTQTENDKVSFNYDPANPCPPLGGMVYQGDANYGPKDQRPISGRPDVVRFTSPVFASDMEFTGEIEVDLHFQTTAEDTMFVVKVVDVGPSGFEALLRDGVCHARYQAGFGEDPASLPRLQPDQVYRLNFKIWAGSFIIRPGHRLAVHITSSSADTSISGRYFEIHPNVFDPVANLTGAPVATQTIHASSAFPSRITVPVVSWQAPHGPQAAVLGNSVKIDHQAAAPSAQNHTLFGRADVSGGVLTRTFTLQNTNQTHALSVSGVSFSGPHAADFSVSAAPASTVAASGATSFTIAFDPSALGTRRATVTVATNVPFIPSYTFAVAGYGAPSGQPLLAVFAADSEELAPGDSSPSWAKWTDFEETRRNRSKTRVFTIENRGLATLNLAALGVSGSPEFTVSAQPASSVAAGGAITFSLTYAPTSAGNHSATVTIPSNDPATPSFTFVVQGFAQNHPLVFNPSFLPSTLRFFCTQNGSFSIRPHTVFYSPDNFPITYTATLAGGAPLPAWLSVDPATGSVSASNPPLAAAGTYSLVIRATEQNAGAAFVEATIPLELTAPLPVITALTPSQYVPVGGSLALGVSVNSSSAVSYQWFLGSSGDNSHPVAGATSAGFTTPPLSAATSYWVAVTNAVGTVASDTIRLGLIYAPTAAPRPATPRANWRVQATHAFATAGSAAFQTGLTTATDIAPISLSASSTWTGTFRVPDTPAGGMLTFSYAHASNTSTVGYTAEALTSTDSTDGVNGTWEPLPLTLYRVDRRAYNKLQKLDLDSSARWVRLTLGTSANGSGSVRDLALYQFDPAGRDDYWLCIGASLQERGVNNTAFKNHIRALTGYDPVIFNVAIGSTTTDNWSDGSPPNLLETVLAAHPRARYVALHLGGNNVTNVRPYVDVNTRPEDQNVRDDLSAILGKVIATGRYPLISRLSYRDYPAPFPVNVGANPQNGSLPYNLHIIDPLVAAYLPDQYNSSLGRARIDAYQFFLDRPHLLSSDGVHMNTEDELVWSTAIWGEMAAPIVYHLALPTIHAHPASVSALAGDRVRLSVSASGANLAYQWLRNGVAVSGATSSTFVIDSLSAETAGSYTVQISSNGGPALTSSPAVVAFTPPPATATRRVRLDFGPTATANPSNGEHWNQITRLVTGTAAAAGTLLDSSGLAVPGLGLRIDSNFAGNFSADNNAGASASGYPLNAANDGHYVNGTDTNFNNGVGISKTATLVFTGLDPGLAHDLAFYGSRGFGNSTTDTRTARFTVNQNTSLRAFLATAFNSTTATLPGLSPASNGELRLDVEARDAANVEQRYTYLNVLTLTIHLTGETYTAWRDDLLPAATVPAELRLPAADADGDGLPNLLEYFAGLPPLAPGGPAAPFSVAPATTASGAPAFAFDFRRARDLHAVHHFLVSDDLATWTVAPATETVLHPDPDGSGTVELRRAIVPAPAGPRAFVRLRITPY